MLAWRSAPPPPGGLGVHCDVCCDVCCDATHAEWFPGWATTGEAAPGGGGGGHVEKLTSRPTLSPAGTQQHVGSLRLCSTASAWQPPIPENSHACLYTPKKALSSDQRCSRYQSRTRCARRVNVAPRRASPVRLATVATARASSTIIAPIVGRQPLPETEPSIASHPSAMM